MSESQVHYELFVRRRVDAPWSLELATEDRARTLDTADEMLTTGHAVAARVTKEMLDPDTGVFKSVQLMAKGAVEAKTRRKAIEIDDTPLCVAPQDLYTGHARERIGRLLDGWLQRKGVTPFELLHRPDLAEQLDASGVEVQHAIQKVAVPEAQARGITTHGAMRAFQRLAEAALERLMRDGRGRVFPDVAGDRFATAAVKLSEGEPEAAYRLGGGVAAHLSTAKSWSEKVGLILDLAETAPAAGRPRALALSVLEQPLGEILGARAGLAELLGPDLDLGASLAALTRLAGGKAVEALIAVDPGLEREIPPLTGHAKRLATWIESGAFGGVRGVLARRVVRELRGPRRLRPADAHAEIHVLRAIAMSLTAAAGEILPLEDVQAAFFERSRILVSAEFVEACVADCATALGEAEGLVWLAENVAGGANKRAAARWLAATVGALRFEKELRFGPDAPGHKLAALARLQRLTLGACLIDADAAAVVHTIGEVGRQVEDEARLVHLLAHAEAPPLQKLVLLLRMACGETAPTGAVADRAKAEALKLLRTPDLRSALAARPETLERVKTLMSQAGLAA